MKKGLKVIGILLLLISMAWASNWDVPKESWQDAHREEVQAYEEERAKVHQVVIGDDVYEGAYIDGMWYEAAELFQEVTDFYLEGGE